MSGGVGVSRPHVDIAEHRDDGLDFAEFRRLSELSWTRTEPLLGSLLGRFGATADELPRLVHEVIAGEGYHQRAAVPVMLVDRLRPGDPDAALAARWAGLAAELLHVASLVHDDVLDEEPKRRRRNDATWARHGVPTAVALGDLLMALGMECLTESRLPAAEQLRLHRIATAVLSEGYTTQTAELLLRTSKVLPTLSWCECASHAKSGALFELSFVSGLACVGADDATIRATAAATRQLGVVFQIIDDLADTVWDVERSKYGDDLWEGKPSWCVALAASRVDDPNVVADPLYVPRAVKDADGLAPLARLLDDLDTVARTLEVFEIHMERVAGSLERSAREVAPLFEPFLLRLVEHAAQLRTSTIAEPRTP